MSEALAGTIFCGGSVNVYADVVRISGAFECFVAFPVPFVPTSIYSMIQEYVNFLLRLKYI